MLYRTTDNELLTTDHGQLTTNKTKAGGRFSNHLPTLQFPPGLFVLRFFLFQLPLDQQFGEAGYNLPGNLTNHFV